MNLIYFVLTNLLVKFSVMISHFLFAKKMNILDFGIASFYLTLVQFFLPILTLSLVESSFKICFSNSAKSERLKFYQVVEEMSITYSLFIFLVFYLLIFFSILIMVPNFSLDIYYFSVAVISSYFQFLTLVFLNKWRVLGFDTAYNKNMASSFFIYLLVVFIFYFLFDSSYITLFFSTLLSLLFVISVNYSRKITRIKISENKIKRNFFLKYRKDFIGNASINLISLSIFYVDLIFLKFLVNPIIVSNYRVASMIVFSLYFIPTTVMSYFVPILIQKKGKDDYFNFILKICLSLFTISLFLFLFLFLTSDFIFKNIFDNKYEVGEKMIGILSFSLFFLFTIRVPFGVIFYTEGRYKLNIGLGVFSLILSPVALFFCSHFFGEKIGVAVSFLTCTILVSFLMLFFFFLKKGDKT